MPTEAVTYRCVGHSGQYGKLLNMQNEDMRTCQVASLGGGGGSFHRQVWQGQGLPVGPPRSRGTAPYFGREVGPPYIVPK